MAGTDSAFLWETEVIRESRRSGRPGPVQPAGGEGDWMTLREASGTTGIPISTLRKWARHDSIPSFLERTPDGNLRLVSITGIRRWADSIGREIDDDVTGEELTSPTEARDEIDLTVEEQDGRPEVPEGSMLVPLDAWNRMLNQLGNLHEAGQQLAEARERAARAETEAQFLRERLKEMRAEREQMSEQPEQPVETEPAGQSQTPSTVRVIRSIYGDWRRRRRRSV